MGMFSVDTNIILCIIVAYITDIVLGGWRLQGYPVKFVSLVVKSSGARFLRYASGLSKAAPDKSTFYGTAAGVIHALYTTLLIFVSLAVTLDFARRLHSVFYYILTTYFIYSTLSVRRLANTAWSVTSLLKKSRFLDAQNKVLKMSGEYGESVGDGRSAIGTAAPSDVGSEFVIKEVIGVLSRGTIDKVISPILFIILGALFGVPVPFVYILKTASALFAYSARNKEGANSGSIVKSVEVSAGKAGVYADFSAGTNANANAGADANINVNEGFTKPGAGLYRILAIIPSMLSCILIPLSAALCGKGFLGSVRIIRRDHSNDLSQKGGVWGEAAFAGALGIQLGGAPVYPGGEMKNPVIGDDLKEPKITDIFMAIRIMITTSVIMLTLSLAVLFFFIV